jgi:hypothetical protein
MRVNVLKRLATTSKMEREYSEGSQYSCEIKFPTIGSGMDFTGRLGSYDINDKFTNEISLNVYSSGSTYYQKASNPVYEKRYEKDLDEQTKKEIREGFDKDRKELQGVAEQINKIYEEAGKKVEAVLKKAGYSLKKGK